jgi:cob(I)alamin adenosyltransferase
MKIYTKKGDTGETGLIGGERASKDDVVFAALGDVDELNASVGTSLVHAKDAEGEGILKRLQIVLFELGAELASPDERWQAKDLVQLTDDMEEWIDRHTALMPELRNFILPGGTLLGASLHQARAVCRRAERSIVELSKVRPVRAEVLAAVNRTSDWLFCAARFSNHEAGIKDTTWSGEL